MAEALKKKHLKDHPDYKYQPRKPADRKRRMTRAKIAALNTATLPSTGPASMTSTPVEPVPLPKLAQTETGNMILDIGHQDLEDNIFRQLLNDYNQTVQPMWGQLGHNVNINGHSAILSTGVTEEASLESNYYSSMLDFDDKLEFADDLAADMEIRMQDATTDSEMWAATGIAQFSPSALRSFNKAYYGTSEDGTTIWDRPDVRLDCYGYALCVWMDCLSQDKSLGLLETYLQLEDLQKAVLGGQTLTFLSGTTNTISDWFLLSLKN